MFCRGSPTRLVKTQSPRCQRSPASNRAAAASDIKAAFNLSTGDFGLASSAFSWAYLALLIPFGILADRVSSRIMITIALVVWSIGAGGTGLAVGIVSLFVARLVLGAGESPTFAVVPLSVREWAPAKERGFFTGAFNAGTAFGPALGAVLCAYLVVSIGWRGSFLVMGAVGLIVGLIWWLAYRKPEDAKWLSKGERDYIIATRGGDQADASPVQPMSIGRLLRSRTLWGLMLTQGAAVYTSYLFLSFLPLYLQQERGLAVLSSGWVTGIIYVITAVGSIVVATASDRIVKGVHLAGGARRKVVVAVMLLSLPLVVLPWVTDTTLIVILVAWVLTMDTTAITLNWALASDLIKDKASGGRSFSLVAVGGNTFGLLAPIVTGYLVDFTGSYTVPFLVAAALMVVGAGASWFMANRPLQLAQS